MIPVALERLSATPCRYTIVPRRLAVVRHCQPLKLTASPVNVASRHVGGGAASTRRRAGYSSPPAPMDGNWLAPATSAPTTTAPTPMRTSRHRDIAGSGYETSARSEASCLTLT